MDNYNRGKWQHASICSRNTSVIACNCTRKYGPEKPVYWNSTRQSTTYAGCSLYTCKYETLRSQDTFVNVVGGLKLEETGTDLAVAMALASTFYETQIQVSENGTPYVFLGEIGLGGEIRPVKQILNRLSVAARLGIKVVFIPAKMKNLDVSDLEDNYGMSILKVATVQESIELGLGLKGFNIKNEKAKGSQSSKDSYQGVEL
mmetsp:Transcript_32197/g.39612  ORF Transcript_32197/g.39612 Transcript_32197/m.39612 type:complete len:203 (+) Transcript_32197:48-656(+)